MGTYFPVFLELYLGLTAVVVHLLLGRSDTLPAVDCILTGGAASDVIRLAVTLEDTLPPWGRSNYSGSGVRRHQLGSDVDVLGRSCLSPTLGKFMYSMLVKVLSCLVNLC